jgi:hypothetical protein
MVKPQSFRPWNPEQTLLLPPSPVDWLPENHLVFFLNLRSSTTASGRRAMRDTLLDAW